VTLLASTLAAALLAAAAPPPPGAAPAKGPARDGAAKDPDAEILENLDLLERLELLDHLEVLEPGPEKAALTEGGDPPDEKPVPPAKEK
jgi:hypothetical protein